MVCSAEAEKMKTFNFKTDPIECLIDGDVCLSHFVSSVSSILAPRTSCSSHNISHTPVSSFQKLKANGTTLGADDGIGVAAALSLLSDKTLVHGPLECLFTMYGA